MTQPQVIECLNQVDVVVHTIVPETYKFWKCNTPGLYPHPLSICIGPTGTVLILAKGETDDDGKLLEVRLHYPCDVKVLQDGIVKPCAVTYADGVCFYLEDDLCSVKYKEVTRAVRIKVSSLRTLKDVQRYLRIHGLPPTGKFPELKEKLAKYLNSKQHSSKSVKLPSTYTACKLTTESLD